MKPTSREAFAGKCASFSRLRRAEPLSCANGRALGRTSQVRASRRRRAARCPTPRRNVRNPLVDAPTRALRHSDATAPDTEFPDAATRHEPPDAPRSGTELSDASPSGAERPGVGRSEAFSSPAQIHAGRRFLARQRPSHAPRPCRATLPLGSGRNNLVSLRANLFCAARKTSSCADQGSSLTSCRAVPTGRRGKKSAGILSDSRRGGRRPKAMSSAENALRPSRRACAASELPPSLGHIFLGSRPQNARRVRREFHKPLPEARARTARQHLHAAPSLGHNGSAPRIVKKYSCV